MSYGFQVVSDTGIVQIDQDFKNYALYSKTVITSGWSSSGSNSYYAVPVPSSGSYMVALQTDSDTVAMMMGLDTIFAFRRTTGGAPVVTAYVFAAATASSETHGLRVFDASGGIVFDSGKKYMRVAYAGTIPDRGATDPASDYTYSGLPSGNWAVVPSFSRQAYRASPGSPGSFQVYRDYYTTSATGFTVRNTTFINAAGNPSGFDNQYSGGPVLVINVAGL